ncbi:hypothetical protein WMY93_005309 [Mugilogobius chulae]|uniref:Uncharacterized protein n=1 Tax=Mugilogobius chulae TaxID=88201 RepID=A0AAW0PUG6_9GOBI
MLIPLRRGFEPGYPVCQPYALPTELSSLVAAGLFIMLLLGLYGVLWKCMDAKVSQRKKSKSRVRVRRIESI